MISVIKWAFQMNFALAGVFRWSELPMPNCTEIPTPQCCPDTLCTLTVLDAIS